VSSTRCGASVANLTDNGNASLNFLANSDASVAQVAVAPVNTLRVLNNNNVAKNSVPLRNGNYARSSSLDRGAACNSKVNTAVRVGARSGLVAKLSASRDGALREWENVLSHD
jgi:hypothetical protein